MTESAFTSDLLARLRRRFPGGEFWKVNDRSTGGVPDVVATLHRRTWRWEVKVAGPNKLPLTLPTEKQLHYLHRLTIQNPGHVALIVRRTTGVIEYWDVWDNLEHKRLDVRLRFSATKPSGFELALSCLIGA